MKPWAGVFGSSPHRSQPLLISLIWRSPASTQEPMSGGAFHSFGKKAVNWRDVTADWPREDPVCSIRISCGTGPEEGLNQQTPIQCGRGLNLQQFPVQNLGWVEPRAVGNLLTVLVRKTENLRVSWVPHRCFPLSPKPSDVSFGPAANQSFKKIQLSTFKYLIGFI